MQAAIQHAIQQKNQQLSFGKIAKDERRLKELMLGNQGRLEHCFKLTPTSIRLQLSMDEEAGYSITDEVTADEITMKVKQLVRAAALDSGTSLFRFYNAVSTAVY